MSVTLMQRTSAVPTNPPMQCAWCRRFYDQDGLVHDPAPDRLDPGLSHGICYQCVDKLYQEHSREQRAAGDWMAACQTVRRRATTLTQLAFRRCLKRSDQVERCVNRSREILASSREILEVPRCTGRFIHQGG